jgi:hypothetical protein
MVFAEFLTGIDNNTKFIYLVISIALLYFFTSILNTGLGHILAVFVIIITLMTMIEAKNVGIEAFNKDIEEKLVNLSDKVPEFMYLDVDLVVFFDNIKKDFYRYHPDSYRKALAFANNLLKIRKDSEVKLCGPPIVPNLLDNFNQRTYLLTMNKDCNNTLVNKYENFQVAESMVKKCMNHLHSFIYTLPSEPVMHLKHKQVLDRGYVLLKRNLDIIRELYEKNQNATDPYITDYDLPKAYNKHTDDEKGIAGKNFNFY